MKKFKEIFNNVFIGYEARRDNMKLYVRIYSNLAALMIYFLQFLPLTPNFISGLMSIFTFIGALFFIKNDPLFFIFGCVLLYFGELLDWVDGALARTINKTSKVLPKFLDDFFHQIPRQFVFLFLGIGGFLSTNNFVYLWLGIIAFSSQLLLVHLSILRQLIISTRANLKFFNEGDKKDNPFVSKKTSFLFDLFVFPMKQNKLIFLIFAAGSFWVNNMMLYSLYFYAPFLFLRYILFWLNSYMGLKNIEKIKKRGKRAL
ncbi:MAG: CDP-alcohol phosphatidyltransferase family protein [Promethearchaeota archaeon]